MPIRSVLIGSVLLTGLFSGNASATTFNISFTQSGLDDSGPDWLGTFDAPESGGLLSAINVNIGGNIYDELGQPPGFSGYRLSYDATKNVLTGTPFWWGTAYNGFPVVSGTLSLGIYTPVRAPHYVSSTVYPALIAYQLYLSLPPFRCLPLALAHWACSVGGVGTRLRPNRSWLNLTSKPNVKPISVFYELEGNSHPVVTVITPWGEKTTQLGWSPAIVIAKMMARELLETFRRAH